MNLLYLDDSGSPLNRSEEYFVLGGISVPENSLRWLSNQVETIAISLHPTNPTEVEFHAAEIFSGKVFPWDRIKNKVDRINTIIRVLQVLDSANIGVVAFACAIHKASYPTEDPVIKAYEEISNRFDLYLTRKREKGIVIIDNCSFKSGLQNLATQIRIAGNRWGGYTRNICEIPLFVDSKAARIVQLADHIAYAVFRRYNANDITYFNQIENRFDQYNGVMCGLVHKQTVNRSCTCPACITRRDRP